MAKETYPETTLLKQVKGVGDLIATAYVLTIEDPHRFRKSRDAGCFSEAAWLNGKWKKSWKEQKNS
jgi:hypothetical protein